MQRLLASRVRQQLHLLTEQEDLFQLQHVFTPERHITYTSVSDAHTAGWTGGKDTGQLG